MFNLSNLNIPALHNHTDFSDGIGSVQSNIEAALTKGLSHIAITDHGTCSGLPVHNQECADNNIGSILGTEFYLRLPVMWESQDGLHLSRNSRSGRYHMTCIIKNWTGYESLITLNNMAHQNIEVSRAKKYPILTFDMMKEVLLKRDSGLIFLTGCVSSPTYHDNLEMAEEYVNFLIKMVGIQNVYAELMPHEITRYGSEEVFNSWDRPLFLSEKLNIKTVWSNDAHAPETEHLEYLRMLTLSKTGNEFTASAIQSPEEMYNDAVRIIGEDKAQQTFINMHNLSKEIETIDFNRSWSLPEADKEIEEFKKRIELALEKDIKINGELLGEDILRKRYQSEYNLLEEYKFWPYYAIIADLCQFANKNNVFYGVRGSANCSYLFYLDGISVLHPVKFKLPFARFINRLRIKSDLPDADLDFADIHRDKVQDYAKERWGMQPVGTLMTYNHSSLVRELSRVFAKMHKDNLTIPDGIVSRASNVGRFKDEIKGIESEEFSEWADYGKWIRPMYELMDGTISGFGSHACAVASTINGIPVPIESFASRPVIAYTESSTHKVLQSLGFAKIDALGLRTFSVIQSIVEMTGVQPPKVIEDGNECFTIFNENRTGGIFQFDTNVSHMLVDMLVGEINSIYTLSDMTSLGRPGPLSQGWHNDYANNTVDIDSLSDVEKTVLSWTKGITIYQEQVAELLGRMIFENYNEDAVEHGLYYMKTIVPKNWRMAESPEFLEKYNDIKSKFVNGAENFHGIERTYATKLFDGLSGFVRYGFALPHSLAYANLAAIQAWQKYHFPAEYWVATLNSLDGNSKYMDRFIRYLVEAKLSGISFVPPHINKAGISGFQLSADKKMLYADISMVKGLGTTKVSELVKCLQDGEFTSMKEVNERTTLNKPIKEILYFSGCFDGLTGDLYDLGVLEIKEFKVPKNWSDNVKSGIITKFVNRTLVIDGIEYTITDEKLLSQCNREIKVNFHYNVVYKLDDDDNLIGFKRVKATEQYLNEITQSKGVKDALGFVIPDNYESLMKFAQDKKDKKVGFVVDITEKDTKFTKQRVLHLHDGGRIWFVLEDRTKTGFLRQQTEHKSIIPEIKIGDLVGVTLVMAKNKDTGETMTYNQIQKCKLIT